MQIKMKRVCLILFFVFSLHPKVMAQDSLVVVFWNMENFFDYKDEGKGEADREFSSGGSRHWTGKRFYAKCDAVAKSFMWMGDRYGRMPDIIGLAEVENRGVLIKLLKYTILRKYDYKLSCPKSGPLKSFILLIFPPIL